MAHGTEKSENGAWNAISVVARNGYLFNNAFCSDFTFIFGGELPMQVPVHKVILASASPVFHAMFYGELREKDVVEVPDVDPEAFLALLRYMYTDEIRLTVEIVMPALYASKKYEVPQFTEACGAFLASTLKPENAVILYGHSRRFGAEDLQSKCLEMIDSHGELALTSEDFAELDHEAVKIIVQRDTLRCRELTVVEAVEKWATAECVRNGVSTSADEKRKVLGDILYKLRIPTMDLDDFVRGIQANGLFTKSEKYDLLCSIIFPNKPSVPFPIEPRAFSTERTKKKVFVPTGEKFSCSRERTIGHFGFGRDLMNYKSRRQSIQFTVTKPLFMSGLRLWSYGSLISTAELAKKCCSRGLTTLATVSPTSNYQLDFTKPIQLDPGEIYILSAERDYNLSERYYTITSGHKEVTVAGSTVRFEDTGEGDTGTNRGECFTLFFQAAAEIH